ncbi:MAG: response regulator transcription factor [Bacteroidota bacterium]
MGRILIVDDDPDVRTLVNVILKKQGFEVETASREEEVFAMIASFDPDIILLDVLLSGADGRLICEQIKSTKAIAHIPVVMCSAHPAAMRNGDYGADDFINKPFTAEILLSKIKNYLPKKAG